MTVHFMMGLRVEICGTTAPMFDNRVRIAKKKSQYLV